MVTFLTFLITFLITTPRLRLRPVRRDDLQVLAALNADGRVMAVFGGAYTREKTVAWLDLLISHWEHHGFGRFIVENGETLVGVVGLSRTDFDAGIVPGIEIAWRLAFQQWGHGYATEAAGAVIEDAFGRLCLDRIIGVTTPDNHRSRAVMDRLGMVYSPSETFEHPSLPSGHPNRTHVVYRLTRDQWLRSQGHGR